MLLSAHGDSTLMLSAGADPLLLVHQQSSNTMGSKSMGRVPLEAAIVRAIKLVQQDGRQQALARWIELQTQAI